MYQAMYRFFQILAFSLVKFAINFILWCSRVLDTEQYGRVLRRSATVLF
jgi:hypothetical protein